jgi:hypothetical protein
VHSPVHATSVYLLGFGAVDCWRRLYSSCTRQSGATQDSPVPSNFAALTSARHCSSLLLFAESTVGAKEPLLHCLTGQSGEL